MDINLEIRKLPISATNKLSGILEPMALWKKLMTIIPKTLSDTSYHCTVDINNSKYKSKHFKMIEAAKTPYKSCTEILLEEWGTSGRIRPKLGHLKDLLEKAHLLVAADYVAIELLGLDAPKRPKTGPAAPVKRNISPFNMNLDNVECSSLDLAAANHSPIDSNINYTDKNPNDTIPKVIISQPSEPELESESQSFELESMAEDQLPNVPIVITPHLPNSVTTAYTKSGNESTDELTNSSIGSEASSFLSHLPIRSQLPQFRYSELAKATNNFAQLGVDQNGLFLAAGSFGSVYLALNLIPNQPAVVKKLYIGDEVTRIDENDPIAKRFCEEVTLLSQLKHENLVALLGYSCNELSLCLIYEYISGSSLRDCLDKKVKTLTATARLRIALDVASGISYLHSKNLIHRDVNSSNILLDSSNRAKLCDFGLTRPASSSKMETDYSARAYCPPEALLDGHVSFKFDSFCFGVVLLELITGYPPHDKKNNVYLVNYIKEVSTEPIESILDTNAGSWIVNEAFIGNEIYEILKQCLINDENCRLPIVEVKVNLNDLLKKVE